MLGEAPTLVASPGSMPGVRPRPILVQRHSRRFRLAFLLLFSFLASLYLLTSGGHTSSNDDEEMYYMTQGLVDRGSLALPPVEGKAFFVAPRSDGKYYPASSHGIVTSVLAIPFYVAGEGVARLFDPAYKDFITHIAVTAVTALSTAGAAVVVSSIAAELGATAGGAIGLGALFGLCTIAWPYSKYFWSEPAAGLMFLLAVLAAIRARRRDSIRAWALSSLFMLLALGARPAMIASYAIVGVYACLGIWEGRRICRSKLRNTALGLGGPLAAGLVGLGGYYLLGLLLGKPPAWVAGLIGNAWAVASHTFNSDLWAGLYGLLLSPGKSVFLYSPPLIAGAVAIPALWRKAWREAVLLVGLFGLQVFLMARTAVWPGDSAWGPRYLVPLTPYLLLPLAAWFRPGYEMRGWMRWGVAATAGVGLAVQLFAVATNYDTYVYVTGGPSGPGAERRLYQPGSSPLLAAPRQLVHGLEAYLRPLRPGEYSLAGGFYPGETPQNVLPRWTDGRGMIRFVAGSAVQG
ncbi:MAG: hypothetical protein KGJ86_12590, partial [Chloroflexota bacterium]|nr:hypothetical protein [Chloroflexota bacterium]